MISGDYGLKINFYKRLVPHVNPIPENFEFGTFQYFNGITIDKITDFTQFSNKNDAPLNNEEIYYSMQRLYLFSIKDITQNHPVYLKDEYSHRENSLPFFVISQLKLKKAYLKKFNGLAFYADIYSKIKNEIEKLINAKIINSNIVYDVYGSLGATEIVLLLRLDNYFDSNTIINKIRTFSNNDTECNHILFSSYSVLCYSLSNHIDKTFL